MACKKLKRECLYHDAGRVYELLERRKGSLKSLVFSQRMNTLKKKAIFALLAKTIENKDTLDAVLEKSQLLSKEQKLTYPLALLILYDVLYGNDTTIKGPLTRTISRYHIALKHIYKQVQAQPVSNSVHLPRYVRVNTLKTTMEEVIERLLKLGYKSNHEISDRIYCIDPLIPDLLTFSPSVDLTTTELYRSRKVILQDKSSCLPSFILSPPPGSVVIDACSAPGNKTSHMAAIMNNTGTIYAFDKDKGRFMKMKRNLRNFGVTCAKCYNKDFLKVDPNKYRDVEYILVDPSCSGSGIVGRHDIKNTEDCEERLLHLSRFQVMILKHALSFPSVKRVVYSTCSIHKQENECVVSEVLSHYKKTFKLSPILTQWSNRGLAEYPQCTRCIRVTPTTDLSQGFFVAMFERTV